MFYTFLEIGYTTNIVHEKTVSEDKSRVYTGNTAIIRCEIVERIIPTRLQKRDSLSQVNRIFMNSKFGSP